MNKVAAFLTNRWFKFGVSFLSIGYPVFLGFVAWLMMSFYVQPTHTGALFTLFLFINVIFGGLMFFTRKQIVTRMCAMITPLISFAILIFGFGNWFIIVPPIVVCVLIFFLCGVSETTKTILGTIYLLMYVVGVLVYLTLSMLLGNITLYDVNLSERSTTYNNSPDGLYRLVTYVEPEKDAQRTVSFYLEETEGDISIPFAECKKVLGCIHINTSAYDRPAKIEWKDDHTLFVDGRQREFTFDPLPETEYSDIELSSDEESSEISSREEESRTASESDTESDDEATDTEE